MPRLLAVLALAALTSPLAQAAPAAPRALPEAPAGHGQVEQAWLAPGVARLRVAAAAEADVVAALAAHLPEAAAADRLVLDLRKATGGSAAGFDPLLPWLLAEPARADAEIEVLLSERSGPAARQLAATLHLTERARVVVEPAARQAA